MERLSWTLHFHDNWWVGSMVTTYNEFLDKGQEEAFIYNELDVKELENLKRDIPPPEFELNSEKAFSQLRAYEKKIKEAFKNGKG